MDRFGADIDNSGSGDDVNIEEDNYLKASNKYMSGEEEDKFESDRVKSMLKYIIKYFIEKITSSPNFIFLILSIILFVSALYLIFTPLTKHKYNIKNSSSSSSMGTINLTKKIE